MRSLGIVSLGREDWWSGGTYYLQHLIRCVDALSTSERIGMKDVWWLERPDVDPFDGVRSILGDSVVVSPPVSFTERVLRKIGKTIVGTSGARDLFEKHNISVFFPKPPCGNSGVPYVAWIPDFQYLRRPDLMSEEMCEVFRRKYSSHAHAAAAVVLSSEDARKDFVRAFPELQAKAHVVRFCSVPEQNWWSRDPAVVAAHYGLPDRFLITCNQFSRHKNHLTLIDALAILHKAGHSYIHLVCTGSTLDFRHEDYVGQVRKRIAQHGLGDNVHILGRIDRAEQIALIRRSIAVLQPSWFEGWSTVVEDAKTLGKALVVSDLPVHHEQLGDNRARYVSLDDSQEWADAIGAAWTMNGPGPVEQEERLGLARLERAKRECGVAFVSAIRAAG